MSTTIKKKMQRRSLRKKQKETYNVYGVPFNKELTLKNVIQTQEQADMFMAMLKHLSSK